VHLVEQRGHGDRGHRGGEQLRSRDHLAPGTVRALDEQGFCAAAHLAADALIQDIHDKMIVIKAVLGRAGAP